MSAPAPSRLSTLDHWESYWKGHADLDRTYSTGGRLAREVLADGAVQGLRVLEVGAGSGRDTLGLARAGAIGLVLDYSPASLELVARQAHEQGVTVHLVRADALAMPFRDGALDVVFHQGLLEHFRDPMPLLRETSRVTASGGRVVVDVPQTLHLYTVMKNALILCNAWFAGWETQFTPGRLERLCERSGLRVRRTYGEFMVPGLAYRVVRELLKRGAGFVLPLDPRGPAWWNGGWEGLRARLLATRAGIHLAHVIGTVAIKP
ncbi:MAG: methyltransferase domain-containing protein [Candidatus Eisenbacteria bacterium]|nr:methyltransferase domain-containing protein [Candidatus Eisenbacteria bacterium]